MPALGRRENFDPRSRNYQIRPLLEREGIATNPPRSYTWSCMPRIDQGNEGSCVGHAWAHEIAARPVVRPADHALAMRIYNRAQQTDPWPETPPEEGTSVLDGVKAAREFGYYREYRWAGAGSGRALEDVVLTLGYKGPVVLGVNWYTGMFDPDSDGLLPVDGAVAGGHAILANGIAVVWKGSARSAITDLDAVRTRVRLHNSWGVNWGIGGEAFLALADLAALLNEGGEACIPIRV